MAALAIAKLYEDDAVISSLAQGLDGWKIFKYDDFLGLFHPKTYGQYKNIVLKILKLRCVMSVQD